MRILCLLQGQWHQESGRHGNRSHGDHGRGATFAPSQQQDRLARDEEACKVVGRDRHGRADRPPDEVAARPLSRLSEEEK
jgi:hypothetical protein